MHPDLITTSIWDDQRNLDLLKAMYGEGASASEIAGAIGQGVTRNAVIGKVHRLKLAKRDSTIRARPSALGKKGRSGSPGQPSVLSIQHRRDGRNGNGLALKIAKARSEGLTLDDVFGRKSDPGLAEDGVDFTRRIRLDDLSLPITECRWCDGDPMTADHSFCGMPVKEGSSWCPSHHARVYPVRA